MEEQIVSGIHIERPLYEQDDIRQIFGYEKPPKKSIISQWNAKKLKIKSEIIEKVPVFKWLPQYKWKTSFMLDIISGCTVAVMHIPQGLAYAMLGNVPPVVGIYMAFFPVLVYFFLGTSRHNSMGTFAVVCLMTGKAVLEHSDPFYVQDRIQLNSTNIFVNQTDTYGYSSVQVAVAVTFTVALFQLAMWIMRLGAISALLSETLVSGFTTGAAIHVLTSQIKDLFGLSIPKYKGYFVILKTMQAIFFELSNVNYAALIISTLTIIVTSLNNEILKPLLAKKSKIPVPIELIAVTVGTLVSKYCLLPERYNIKTVGTIPNGLPHPSVPPFDLLTSVVFDGFSIAVVSYTVTLSMALIFAQKLHYEVDANQELLAMGSGNILGSFFSCMPVCASLSRSLIQQVVGGQTQIASIVSCTILLAVLLWIGPFFEPLPKSVLAGVIVVSLKGMLQQITAVHKFWRLSKIDAMVWIITLLTVVFVSIDIGLLTGVVMSLISIFILGFKPYTCLLGSIPKTDLYLDINRYKAAKQIDGIKIFQYCGGINFATKNIFKKQLFDLVGINPQKEIIYRSKLERIMDKNARIEGKEKEEKIQKIQRKLNSTVRCLIIDFSSVSYVDPSGVTALKNITESFQKINIPVYIAACSDPVYNMMNKCDLISKNSSVHIFPTLQDAVQRSKEIHHNLVKT